MKPKNFYSAIRNNDIGSVRSALANGISDKIFYKGISHCNSSVMLNYLLSVNKVPKSKISNLISRVIEYENLELLDVLVSYYKDDKEIIGVQVNFVKLFHLSEEEMVSFIDQVSSLNIKFSINRLYMWLIYISSFESFEKLYCYVIKSPNEFLSTDFFNLVSRWKPLYFSMSFKKRVNKDLLDKKLRYIMDYEIGRVGKNHDIIEYLVSYHRIIIDKISD